MSSQDYCNEHSSSQGPPSPRPSPRRPAAKSRRQGVESDSEEDAEGSADSEEDAGGETNSEEDAGGSDSGQDMEEAAGSEYLSALDSDGDYMEIETFFEDTIEYTSTHMPRQITAEVLQGYYRVLRNGARDKRGLTIEHTIGVRKAFEVLFNLSEWNARIAWEIVKEEYRRRDRGVPSGEELLEIAKEEWAEVRNRVLH